MNAKRTVTDARRQMFEEGFTYVSAWQDSPNLDYGMHTHHERVGIYVISGSVVLYFGKDRLILKAGSRLDVPAGMEHGTVIGPDGAVYVLGEMVAGDAELSTRSPYRPGSETQERWS